MKYRELGRTGLAVSEIGFGAEWMERHNAEEVSAIVRYAEDKGVQTRLLFAGNFIKQPCFDSIRGDGTSYRTVGELKNTDRIMRDTFWIGVYPGMTDDRLEYMARTIREGLKRQ